LALLAAGGVAVAQLWGLGLGAARAAGDGTALMNPAPVAAPTAIQAGLDLLPHTTGIDGLLRDRLRTGGLPLPGQAAGLPDAFAIAAGLQPRPTQPGSPPDPAAAPAQPAPPVGATKITGTTGTTNHPTAAPPKAAAPARTTPHYSSTAARRAAPEPPALPDAPAAAGARPEPDRPLAATTEDTDLQPASAVGRAVLIPIAAGLLLTGAAMYKHRGLPRGH
jgi:hypothetical protein